jgi:hypothetical protein
LIIHSAKSKIMSAGWRILKYMYTHEAGFSSESMPWCVYKAI